MSMFFSDWTCRVLPTRVLAARLTATTAVIAALDVVVGLAVNAGVDSEIREPWYRYVPGVPALVVFGVLTVALVLRTRWAATATFLASAVLFSPALLNLLLAVMILAGAAPPASGPTWYSPVQSLWALLEVMLFLALAVLLAPSTRDTTREARDQSSR